MKKPHVEGVMVSFSVATTLVLGAGFLLLVYAICRMVTFRALDILERIYFPFGRITASTPEVCDVALVDMHKKLSFSFCSFDDPD